VSESANLATTRAIFGQFAEGGFSVFIDRFDEWFAPSVEWKSTILTAFDARLFRGRNGLGEYVREFEAAFTVESVDLGEIRAVGDHTVLVLATMHARGASSEVPFEQETGYVFAFADGLITRGQSFRAHAEAEATARDWAAQGERARA
jgi:ketosteroid isomerase-like protein